MLAGTLFFLLVILMGLFAILVRVNDSLVTENESLKLDIEDLKLQNNRMSEDLDLLELSNEEMRKINFKNLSNSK